MNPSGFNVNQKPTALPPKAEIDEKDKKVKDASKAATQADKISTATGVASSGMTASAAKPASASPKEEDVKLLAAIREYLSTHKNSTVQKLVGLSAEELSKELEAGKFKPTWNGRLAYENGNISYDTFLSIVENAIPNDTDPDNCAAVKSGLYWRANDLLKRKSQATLDNIVSTIANVAMFKARWEETKIAHYALLEKLILQQKGGSPKFKMLHDMTFGKADNIEAINVMRLDNLLNFRERYSGWTSGFRPFNKKLEEIINRKELPTFHLSSIVGPSPISYQIKGLLQDYDSPEVADRFIEELYKMIPDQFTIELFLKYTLMIDSDSVFNPAVAQRIKELLPNLEKMPKLADRIPLIPIATLRKMTPEQALNTAKVYEPFIFYYHYTFAENRMRCLMFSMPNENTRASLSRVFVLRGRYLEGVAQIALYDKILELSVTNPQAALQLFANSRQLTRVIAHSPSDLLLHARADFVAVRDNEDNPEDMRDDARKAIEQLDKREAKIENVALEKRWEKFLHPDPIENNE